MTLKKKLKLFIKNSSCKLGRIIASEKLKNVENFLIENCSDRNAAIIKEHFENLEDDDGHFSRNKMWHLKKKLLPQIPDPPMVKQDENGELVSSPELLLDLYLRTYEDRLKQRDMNPKYLEMLRLKKTLWQHIHEMIKDKKTKPWTMEDLDKVLRKLNKNSICSESAKDVFHFANSQNLCDWLYTLSDFLPIFAGDYCELPCKIWRS